MSPAAKSEAKRVCSQARDLGALFSSLGCSIFEIWVLCFEIWVLRASVFVFECFAFEIIGAERQRKSRIKLLYALKNFNVN